MVRQQGILFLTSDKGNKYVLVGKKIKELRKYIGQSLTVFGKIMKPKPLAVDGKLVTCNIDVTKYGSILSIGQSMSIAQLEEIRKKVEAKERFKQEVLTKLGKENIFEVVKGKMYKELRTVPEYGEVEYLMLENGYKEKYLLVGRIAEYIKNNFDKYKNKTVVILGEVILPMSNYPVERDVLTFRVREIYDENLNLILKE